MSSSKDDDIEHALAAIEYIGLTSPPDSVEFKVNSLLELRAEILRLRGFRPELPPRPPDGDGLPRYGLRHNGPGETLATPMDDGYWTPWHLAERLTRERDALLAHHGRCQKGSAAPAQAEGAADSRESLSADLEKVQTELDEKTTSERTLRRLLAFAYSGSNLYGDDGELQDSRLPMIDYVRDSVAEIERKITERGNRQLAAQQSETKSLQGLRSSSLQPHLPTCSLTYTFDTLDNAIEGRKRIDACFGVFPDIHSALKASCAHRNSRIVPVKNGKGCLYICDDCGLETNQ